MKPDLTFTKFLRSKLEEETSVGEFARLWIELDGKPPYLGRYAVSDVISFLKSRGAGRTILRLAYLAYEAYRIHQRRNSPRHEDKPFFNEFVVLVSALALKHGHKLGEWVEDDDCGEYIMRNQCKKCRLDVSLDLPDPSDCVMGIPDEFVNGVCGKPDARSKSAQELTYATLEYAEQCVAEMDREFLVDNLTRMIQSRYLYGTLQERANRKAQQPIDEDDLDDLDEE